MKDVISNLEKLITDKRQELSNKVQELETLKAEVLKLLGALELALALDKSDNKEPNDSNTDSEQPASAE